MTIIRPNRPAPVGAEAVPDSHGLNLYRADPMLAALLPLYLPRDLLDHLTPHLDRLGGEAGGRLTELAATADVNPPVLNMRTRRGEDAQSITYHPAYLLRTPADKRKAWDDLKFARATWQRVAGAN